MKRTLSLIFFLLLSSAVLSAQSSPLQVVDPTIGIGRLQISLNDSIPLYRSADDIRAFDTLVFSKVAVGTDKGKFIVSTTSGYSIEPYSFFPGDSYDQAVENVKAGLAYHHPVLVFRAVKLVKGEFEVVLNEKTFETCVIKKDKKRTLYTNGTPYWSLNHSSEASDPAWFLYESWSTYLKRLIAVAVTDPVLYDNPNGVAILSPKGDLSFQVVYTIEDWIKVRLTGEQKDGVRDEVWLRWTDGRTLLVNPIEEEYY